MTKSFKCSWARVSTVHWQQPTMGNEGQFGISNSRRVQLDQSLSS
jgi:hypothetical protein